MMWKWVGVPDPDLKVGDSGLQKILLIIEEGFAVKPFMSAETIAVAMSGGVDSSTVAAMLRAEGHTVVGLTMQLWNQRRLAEREGMPEQVQGRCCSIDDVYDARRVPEDLGIPYYVVNHEERFDRDVLRPFAEH